MLEISCSIVIYHNPVEDLRKAIESFLNCSKSIRLYLIDNSADDTLRYQFLSPQIEYIHTGKNMGYGAGHNIAIRKALGRSKYHIILNPDIEFNPATLEGLYDFMQQNANVGLVMPKVLYRNGLTQYLCKELPSPADLFLRRFFPGPIKFAVKKLMEQYELRHKDYDTIMEVPNLSGCFMFIRTAVFETVGLFDEQYFMYLEDTDLSRRINRYYRTVYYPKETITHGYSKASYKNFKLMLHHLTSSIKYFNKWGWFTDQNRLLINRYINYSSFRPQVKTTEQKNQLQQHIISFE